MSAYEGLLSGERLLNAALEYGCTGPTTNPEAGLTWWMRWQDVDVAIAYELVGANVYLHDVREHSRVKTKQRPLQQDVARAPPTLPKTDPFNPN
jgi:hypothetical protein